MLIPTPDNGDDYMSEEEMMEELERLRSELQAYKKSELALYGALSSMLKSFGADSTGNPVLLNAPGGIAALIKHAQKTLDASERLDKKYNR